MANLTKKERKESTYQAALKLFQTYDKFILVGMDNVTAFQLQEMKKEWRKDTEILLGKNTVIKKALLEIYEKTKKKVFKDLHDMLTSNLAFVFTKNDPKVLKEIMTKNSRDTFAAIGQISQKDVWLKKHITSMGPEKTKFFQALDIFTKITKGKVEIMSDVLVLKEGTKVTPSQANLLSIMGVKAFVFFMKIVNLIEDGHIYEPWVIDIEEDTIKDVTKKAIESVGAVCMATGFSSKLTVPFEMANAYRNVLSVCLAADFRIAQTEALTN
ncbi:hypothetical protein EDEG_03035 [Edhazardia aedis USNM 41457]|uniref:Large ribosomal subunit protein uL10 n=1 Tax=Edhazardia aedis (strain USNM 41457) TaxID=1003232 RepID=J9DMJ5_EDHAE|nr:hypothetical protein EDEG_03035 [Edhazardia aedis USNM 41457]|eukprot:EJW02557.1 hypothetical protein EDEG_03035 [Edhazardia aedis USNM 41457]